MLALIRRRLNDDAGIGMLLVIGITIFVAGLVGGARVLLGTLLGYSVSSEPLELLFYAVSAGAILYVVGEIWTAMRRFGHRELGLLALSAGVFVGIATEMIIAYGGG